MTKGEKMNKLNMIKEYVQSIQYDATEALNVRQEVDEYDPLIDQEEAIIDVTDLILKEIKKLEERK